MKPFNLDEAKAGKPLVTRDGRKARFIAHVPECRIDWRLQAYIDGDEFIRSFNENGVYNGVGNLDLFMASEKRTGWINIYPNKLTGKEIFETENEAFVRRTRDAIATIRIEWNE